MAANLKASPVKCRRARPPGCTGAIARELLGGCMAGRFMPAASCCSLRCFANRVRYLYVASAQPVQSNVLFGDGAPLSLLLVLITMPRIWSWPSRSNSGPYAPTHVHASLTCCRCACCCTVVHRAQHKGACVFQREQLRKTDVTTRVSKLACLSVM